MPEPRQLTLKSSRSKVIQAEGLYLPIVVFQTIKVRASATSYVGTVTKLRPYDQRASHHPAGEPTSAKGRGECHLNPDSKSPPSPVKLDSALFWQRLAA